MKIIKITERTFSPDEEGFWRVYAMCRVGKSYRYGVLLYDTFDEAREAQEGDNVDIERVRFSRRINGVIV